MGGGYRRNLRCEKFCARGRDTDLAGLLNLETARAVSARQRESSPNFGCVPEAPRRFGDERAAFDHFFLIEIWRDLAAADFGSVTVRIPDSLTASTRSASTAVGSVSERENLP